MVYGDMLAFFPEQFRMFSYLHMTPNPSASYSDRKDLGKVKGVFQFIKKGELLGENATETDTDVPALWTRQKLKVGDYFIEKEDELYRITNNFTWKFEGGFYCYGLELFIGNSDTQKPFDYVDIGDTDYA